MKPGSPTPRLLISPSQASASRIIDDLIADMMP
jgi:hypothetical protein